MQRLQKYNLWLLAIIGTGALLLLFACGAIVLFNLVNKSDLGLSTNPSSVEPKKVDSIFQYRQPILIDSFQNVYIIPISTPQSSRYDDFKSDYSHSKPLPWEAEIIYADDIELLNILVYKPESNWSQPIFRKKVAIISYQAVMVGIQYYLLMQVVDNDSNKDGWFNSKDLSSFYLYSFEQGNIKKVNMPNTDLMRFELRYNSNDVLLLLGIDANKDNSFSNGQEPTMVAKVDLNTGQEKVVTDARTTNEVRAIFEGK